MSATLSATDFRRALLAMADAVIEAEARLNELDAAIGDGDHGITMRLGFMAVKHHLAQLREDASFEEVLNECGQAFMGATGGAIGIILAKMLMAAGGALRGCRDLGGPELAAILTGMENAIGKAGKAKPGDKTILDAVHAARKAAQAAAESQVTLPQALQASALAAETAAGQTADLVCRVGRASRLGQRTLGHPDPGAVSFAIMMRAFERSAAN